MVFFPNGSVSSPLWPGAAQAPNPQPMTVEIAGDNAGMPQINKDGSIEIELPDGSLHIDLNPRTERDGEGEFAENLAEVLSEGELDTISSEVLDGIEADKQSRQEWLEIMSKGMDILGFKLEAPKIDVGSSAPLEGMSTVRHPMLQQAILMFQANFRGEMLPGTGPVKIQTYGDETQETDDEAETLAEDMNYWFTQVATEYYPDTMRMAYQYGFCGHGIKKVYPCPIRRRPVSESVPMDQFIVSNTATDLRNAERITQIIKMSKNVLKRMQHVGAYRKIDLGTPSPEPPNQIRNKVSGIEGIKATPQRQEDYQYEIYECYCYLNIPGYEHKDEDGHETGIALPYRVCIDSSSRKVLSVHRDWDEDDEDCLRQDTFVDYVFIYGFGYYGMGLLHLLGNTAVAATGAWRLFIDALMFANFPGLLYLKRGNRQTNNTFRVAPGSAAPVDGGGNQDIRQTIMALPYKPPDPASIQFIENVIATAERLGGTAQTQIAEGKQEAPVGTTLALLEQQTKAMSAVHKNAHTSQAKEFQLLRDLFRQYPETLMSAGRRNRRRRSKIMWTRDRILQALDNYDIVPVADPNTPTHMHRIAKGVIIKQLQGANPQLYDAKAVDTRVMHMAQIDDPQSLFAPPAPPGAQAPDPKLLMAQAANQKNQVAMQSAAMKLQSANADRQSRERLEQMRIAQTEAVHPGSAPLVHEEMGNLGSGMAPEL
jgi:hypothetical protein